MAPLYLNVRIGTSQLGILAISKGLDGRRRPFKAGNRPSISRQAPIFDCGEEPPEPIGEFTKFLDGVSLPSPCHPDMMVPRGPWTADPVSLHRGGVGSSREPESVSNLLECLHAGVP